MREVGFFFFQAEDGIRDLTVTGVQTCALPICVLDGGAERWRALRRAGGVSLPQAESGVRAHANRQSDQPGYRDRAPGGAVGPGWLAGDSRQLAGDSDWRSEERRVGKECRSRWS